MRPRHRPTGSRRSPMCRAVEPLVILARLMGLLASSGSISDPPSPAARERRPAKPRSPQRGFLTPTPSPAFPDLCRAARLLPGQAASDPRGRAAAPRRAPWGHRGGAESFERKSGWRSWDLSKARLGGGETRCARRMVCPPSRRSGRQADCSKGVAIQPSGLRRDVAEDQRWKETLRRCRTCAVCVAISYCRLSSDERGTPHQGGCQHITAEEWAEYDRAMAAWQAARTPPRWPRLPYLGRGYCFAPCLPTTRWLIACNSISCDPVLAGGDRMQFDQLKRREFITHPI